MTTVLRQWGYFVLMAVFIVVPVLAVTFWVFPVDSVWTVLEAEWMTDVSYLTVIVGVLFGLATLFGLMNGLYWRRVMIRFSTILKDMTNGKVVDTRNDGAFEIRTMAKELHELQAFLQEQTKTSQKLTNEKVEDQEKRIQELVNQERHRIARELHDSVSQQLFAASMMMSALTETKREDDPSAETRQLKHVETMIQQSQLEMRALLLHLRPAALKGKSLRRGIEELLTELAQKVPMDMQWRLEEVPLEKGVEDHLFRILQESVSNTLRHSKASLLEILLIEREERIILRVSDDGVGFDVSQEKSGAYGLQNMNERAVELGGTMHMVSVPSYGTRIEVQVPRFKEEEQPNDSGIISG